MRRSGVMCAAAAACALVAIGVAGVPVAVAAGAASASGLRTVTVRISKSAMHLSTGHRVHAGLVQFRVVGVGTEHGLQVVRLHKGYSAGAFGSDIGKAFGGDVAAVRRVDHRATLLGGANGRPGRPGSMVIRLRAGRYLLVDTEGNAASFLDVRGTAGSAPLPSADGRITALTYGFEPSRHLPASGVINFGNVSDQPHVFQLQQVKQSTTHRQVARFIRSGVHHTPPWQLSGSAGTGVISPYRHELMPVDLPPGKYLLLCYWPDDKTGMPHFMMGMWRLVQFN